MRYGTMGSQARSPVAAVAKFESMLLLMMDYPVNVVCSVADVMIHSEATALAAFPRVLWRLSDGAAPRRPRVPKAARKHTFRDTTSPESCASPAKRQLSHSFKSEILELLP